MAWLRLLLFLALIVGHIGFWIWLFNRVNALGLERKTIKLLEKSIVLLCGALPFFLFLIEWRYGAWGDSWQRFWEEFQEPDFYRRGSIASLIYFGLVLAFLVWNLPRWFAHRPFFAIAKNRYYTLDQNIESHLHRRNPHWVVGSMTRLSLSIPGNEILSLETNIKRVCLDGIAPSFLGLRIGHISDIHLTGQIAPEFIRYGVDWLVSQGIELLILSGDLVDDAAAVPQLERALGGLPKDLPKLFVLGNHDRAYNLVEPTRATMVELGWLDAGRRDWWLPSKRGWIQALGNELPWLERHGPSEADTPKDGDATRIPGIILGISHSPDQFSWARSKGCHLLLCGHTHGGQVRFPGIGPIIAPSRHGSRFASGVFFQPPTLMHVSRGVSGTHPLRWRCPPEASILEIAESPGEKIALG